MRGNSKKGQFYLIAAIIIVVIMVGFLSVSNYSKRKGFINLFDLGEELEIESGEVLDYGVYNDFTENEIVSLITNFTETYSIYAGEGKVMYFLFGDEDRVVVAGYSETLDEIYVNIGSNQDKVTYYFEIGNASYEAVTYYPQGEEVTVRIAGITYDLDLNEGDYFYFVISQEIEGETYVVTP